jgi:hypothetical protein
MKRVFILLIAFSYWVICNASHINEISNFEYSHKVMDHDLYMGSVLKYEDRLFLNNQYKIEELQILEDGTVEPISMYETKINIAISDFIDENRYYSIRKNELGSHRLLIFDISITPMSLLSEIELPYNGPYSVSHIITDNYVYFTDYQIQGSHRFNKETMEIDGFLTGLYGGSTSYQGKPIILFAHYQDGNLVDVSFRVYNELQDDIELFDFEDFNDEIFLGAPNQILSMIIKDNKLFLLGRMVLYVYDLSDIENIELIAFIDERETIIDNYFIGVDIYENTIYTSTASGIIMVYELTEDEVINTLNYFNALAFGSYKNNLVFSFPYLYYTIGTMLEIFNVSDIDHPIQYYGRDYVYNSLSYVTENSYYVASYNMQLGAVDFYSAFEEESYMFSIEKEFNDIYIVHNFNFCINEDLLFFYHKPIESDFYVVDVYQINDNILEYLYQIQINSINKSSLRIKNNMLFINRYNNNNVEIQVYDIDNEFEYITSFPGKILDSSGIESDYLIYKDNNQLCFRELDNIDEIVHYIQFPPSESDYPYLINDEYVSFLNSGTMQDRFSVYSFDLFNELMSLTDTYYGRGLNTFKGFLTDNCQNQDYSIYYNIHNGEINEIGQQYEQKYVQRTYIYPELHKMVQYAHSGIHVYDIEYTVSSSDQVVEYERDTYVYPNPVNGGDVNFKTALSGNDTEISIYNIKGQLVKTSKAFQTKDNESIFTWDKRNNQNQSVASGVYFYKIKTDDKVKTGKFLIMK